MNDTLKIPVYFVEVDFVPFQGERERAKASKCFGEYDATNTAKDLTNKLREEKKKNGERGSVETRIYYGGTTDGEVKKGEKVGVICRCTLPYGELTEDERGEYVARRYNAEHRDVIEECIEHYYKCDRRGEACATCKNELTCDIAIYDLSLDE